MNLRKAVRVIAAVGMISGVAARAAEYKVDPVHSTVEFRVKHMNASMAYGRFNAVAGSFILDNDPAKSSFELTVKADSIDTASANRDQHLKSPDFFNAKQFPTIAFKSKSVTSAGQGAYEVMGDLTLHGVTKPVTVKVVHIGNSKDMKGKPIAGVESVFTINRSDYGMKGMAAVVGDEVRITVSLEGGAK